MSGAGDDTMMGRDDIASYYNEISDTEDIVVPELQDVNIAKVTYTEYICVLYYYCIE